MVFLLTTTLYRGQMTCRVHNNVVKCATIPKICFIHIYQSSTRHKFAKRFQNWKCRDKFHHTHFGGTPWPAFQLNICELCRNMFPKTLLTAVSPVFRIQLVCKFDMVESDLAFIYIIHIYIISWHRSSIFSRFAYNILNAFSWMKI